MKELPAQVNPADYEEEVWNKWAKGGYFRADSSSSKKPFTILMPPPNVTSQLHMGHGTCYTFQDLLIRWKRMEGFNACWLPGTDHAGIATQMMVERQILKDEGLTRQQLGRTEFTRRLEAWKNTYGELIYSQFEKIGFSADWSRKAYTMDPGLSEAVRYVFVDWFKKGLIYRGERLVNWDPVLKTAISDDEVQNQEVSGHIWHIAYKVEDSDESIVIATTRPETLLGDVAVAVHPEDQRYQHLVGKNAVLPFTKRVVPIVADDYVKMDFGTGALKITPAHDPNDFEIGRKHGLTTINIFDEEARILPSISSEFAGQERFEARKNIVKKLDEQGQLLAVIKHKIQAPISERSKAIIEPRLSKQWYVKMKPLAEPAAEAARKGDLRFYPDSLKKTYLHWLDNIQDWCISRQLWWGHRIPIWTCGECKQYTSELHDPKVCSHCGSTDLKQDEDVLDTWFSSQLWPLSPFGWPDEKKSQAAGLSTFYPSQVLVTADEIIFLWVARMVMVGLHYKGQVPFRDIYFSAVVCDKQGRKFSKTLGNGIDPLEVIEKYGADAVRFTGVNLAPLGSRICMSHDDFLLGSKFINKIWNAARFLDRFRPAQPLQDLDLAKLDLPEKWLITEFAQVTQKVKSSLSLYRLNEAVEGIYVFIWGSFCDWGLECAKERLQAGDEALFSLLSYCFEGALRLAHPIIPFVTEKLWDHLPAHPRWPRAESLCISDYPSAESIPQFSENHGQWASVQELVGALRSVRQQVGISPKERLSVEIYTEEKSVAELFAGASSYIERLANFDKPTYSKKLTAMKNCLLAQGKGFKAFIPAGGLIDFSKEIERLEKEMSRLDKIILGLDSKLSNQDFVARAPEAVLLQTKNQRENLLAQKESARLNLSTLKI